MEWNMDWKLNFTVGSTLALCVPDTLVPFHSVRPQKSLLYCG